MNPPHPHHTSATSTPRGQKRTADFSPTPAPAIQNTTTPRILHRPQHRRRNIAARTWGPEPPPPPPPSSHTPQPRTTTSSFRTPRFNIYKSLLRHPNLFFPFCIRLPYASMVSLYAIDKEFHYRLNKHSVSVVHEYARYHAAGCCEVFSWVLFPELCISDPMLRPMDGRAWLARDVGGFRWVGMVLWRDGVVRGILSALAREGMRVHRRTFGVLCKFWCVMECKTSAVRRAFLRDETIWSDDEIRLFHAFCISLDLRFAHPVLGNGIAELGRLLLSQKGLGTLYKVLTKQMVLDYDTATDMLVRTYLSEDLDTDTHPWLDDELDNGVPEEEWGLLCREGWHVDGQRMDSAVDMVVMEGIRRGLDVHKYYLEFVMYGFVDGNGQNVPVPRVPRKGNSAGIVEVGWPSEQTRRDALAHLQDLAGASGRDEMDVDV